MNATDVDNAYTATSFQAHRFRAAEIRILSKKCVQTSINRNCFWWYWNIQIQNLQLNLKFLNLVYDYVIISWYEPMNGFPLIVNIISFIFIDNGWWKHKQII